MLKKNLYELGERLGLNKKDIDYTLKYGTVIERSPSLSFGPGYDGGTLYGTVSIDDL